MQLVEKITLKKGLIVSGIANQAEKEGDMNKENRRRATFAGGCFWCMEPPFDKLEGVISTTSGYMGGDRKNPTYEEASSGGTGHAEVVPAGEFYPAEDYHQDYYQKNPIRYKFYRHGSGRDKFLEKTWGDKKSK